MVFAPLNPFSDPYRYLLVVQDYQQDRRWRKIQHLQNEQENLELEMVLQQTAIVIWVLTSLLTLFILAIIGCSLTTLNTPLLPVFTQRPIILTVSPTLKPTKCIEISKKTVSTQMYRLSLFAYNLNFFSRVGSVCGCSGLPSCMVSICSITTCFHITGCKLCNPFYCLINFFRD